VKRPSAAWRKQAAVYLHFVDAICPEAKLDRDDDAALKQYAFESRGERSDLSRNAYAVGKAWANVQVNEWRQGIADGLFSPDEFTADPEIGWWADRALDGC